MRYCSDAIAIAQVAALVAVRYVQGCDVGWAIETLDMAERELRHNKDHKTLGPLDGDETFGVEPVRKEK